MDGVWHSYHFSDANAQIGSKDDGQSVEWIGVLLPELGRRSRFPIGLGSLVLGESTLADVLALAPDATFKKEFSSKHWCFWTECYFGCPGPYRHYLFGVMEAPCALPPPFEWDHVNDRLASDPRAVRFNWAAVSSTRRTAQGFNFWGFV